MEHQYVPAEEIEKRLDMADDEIKTKKFEESDTEEV